MRVVTHTCHKNHSQGSLLALPAQAALGEGAVGQLGASLHPL